MSSTEAEIDHLRNDIQKLRADIENLGATMARVVRAGAREAGENAGDAMQDVRADLRQTAERVTYTIKDNPLASALAAIGIGMLLGRLCSGGHMTKGC